MAEEWIAKMTPEEIDHAIKLGLTLLGFIVVVAGTVFWYVAGNIGNGISDYINDR